MSAQTTTTRGGRTGMWRSRWAAIGAAVAVSIGAGGIAIVSAASDPSSLVAISPARILDTRTDLGLAGEFTSPTGRTLQVTGPVATPNGTATVVPAGATAVVLNVTAVTPTADGFISVRPGDATGAPSTSSLNFSAGQVVPNAVTVELPANGTIDIVYDAYGAAGPTTDVLVDVTGYFVVGTGAPGPAGPIGPAGPAGPEGTSPVIVFSASLAFGEEYTIVESGGSRIYADCYQTGGSDHIDIVATSASAEWYTNQNDTTANAPGGEVDMETNSVATGDTRYYDDIDEGHMMTSDGHYLAYQQETTATGLNIFGADCVVAGLAFMTTVDF